MEKSVIKAPSRSRRVMAVSVAVVAAVLGGAVLLRGFAPGDGHGEWALLDKYCVDCHNAQDWTADIAFDTLTPDSVQDDPALFEKAVRKLRGRMMPPPGRDLPTEREYESLIDYFEASLDRRGQNYPNPGFVGVRRLNRTEYTNAIEDLFGLRLNPRDLLPKDDESGGFDNVANVLSESPSFVDQYVSAARTVATLALSDTDTKYESRTYYARGETNQSRHNDGMPLGTRGGIAADHYFPVDGIYEFGVDGLVLGDYTPGLEYRHKALLFIDDNEVFERDVGGDEDMRRVDQELAPALAELNAPFSNIRVPVSAGLHKVGFTFLARSLVESDETLQPFLPGGGDERIMSPRRLHVAGPIEITGEGRTTSRDRIFICRPSSTDDELPCAQMILGAVARHAFRRPITPEDLEGPLEFYASGRAEGSFEAGVRNGLMAILVSPKFLYRAESPPQDSTPGEIYRIGDIELASRLSFFLWSRLPDDELLEIAAEGKLSDPRILQAQVRRMLGDPRARSLITNFSAMWLELRELDTFNADPALFPGVDRELRDAIDTEIDLFLASILLENRSVLDLLRADHTFVNERLALHYGLPNVQGDQFRRVVLEDPNRWGLLGKAAVLMITSYPNRTAPVLRGAWVLDHLMGSPPPSPPANVPALPETVEGGEALTVRARLEAHRKNPSCNACHGIMDPLGFALENYDAVGSWRDRDREAGDAIDSTGQMVDGTIVSTPRELSLALLERPGLLAQTLTEKLMLYALGRQIEYFDMPTIRRIVSEAAKDDYRFYAIIEGIVASDAFQYQRAQEH